MESKEKISLQMMNKEIGWFLGKTVTNITHDPNIVKSGGLYHKSWDWLMEAVEKIHSDHLKQGIEGRDLMYTIKYLLGGGYMFGSDTELPSYYLTIDALHQRVYDTIVWLQINNNKI